MEIFLGLYKGQVIIHICFDDYLSASGRFKSNDFIKHIICCIYINIPFNICKNSMEQVTASAVMEEEVEIQRTVNSSRTQDLE